MKFFILIIYIFIIFDVSQGKIGMKLIKSHMRLIKIRNKISNTKQDEETKTNQNKQVGIQKDFQIEDESSDQSDNSSEEQEDYLQLDSGIMDASNEQRQQISEVKKQQLQSMQRQIATAKAKEQENEQKELQELQELQKQLKEAELERIKQYDENDLPKLFYEPWLKQTDQDEKIIEPIMYTLKENVDMNAPFKNPANQEPNLNRLKFANQLSGKYCDNLHTRIRDTFKQDSYAAFDYFLSLPTKQQNMPGVTWEQFKQGFKESNWPLKFRGQNQDDQAWQLFSGCDIEQKYYLDRTQFTYAMILSNQLDALDGSKCSNCLINVNDQIEIYFNKLDNSQLHPGYLSAKILMQDLIDNNLIGKKGDTRPINEFILKADDQDSTGSLNKREFKQGLIRCWYEKDFLLNGSIQ